MSEDPRSWELFGAANEKNGVYSVVGDAFFVRLHGMTPVPIRLVEDPEGIYFGWLDAQEDEPDPLFVQHERIFEISFPYGSKAEEDAGHGKKVRLRIEERDG
jgi:hypothetical protein